MRSESTLNESTLTTSKHKHSSAPKTLSFEVILPFYKKPPRLRSVERQIDDTSHPRPGGSPLKPTGQRLSSFCRRACVIVSSLSSSIVSINEDDACAPLPPVRVTDEDLPGFDCDIFRSNVDKYNFSRVFVRLHCRAPFS